MAPTEFDPSRSVTLLNPIRDRWINSNQIKVLYEQDQLTQEEYILLDYLGALEIIKDGAITVSFQGLKRKIDLHQARLTKALKRLMEKGLISKGDSGYTLTHKGGILANELMKKFGRQSTLENTIHSHVALGSVQGPPLSSEEHRKLTDALSGKWFGEFRFMAKTEYTDGTYEIEWISTSGSIGAKLIIGPENEIKIIISSAKIIQSEIDLQLMMERISTHVERVLDSGITWNARETYLNRSKLEEEDVPSMFAS